MDKVIWKVEIEGRVCNKITYAVQAIVMDDFKGDGGGSGGGEICGWCG